jgi:hypothetical protein
VRSPNAIWNLCRMSVVRVESYGVAIWTGEVRKAGLRIRVRQQPLKLLEILLRAPRGTCVIDDVAFWGDGWMTFQKAGVVSYELCSEHNVRRGCSAEGLLVVI